MGINRITTGFLSRQSINYLNGNLKTLSELQEKLSSGKNINRPGDDPVGLTRILDLSNTLRTDDRYSRNISNALSEVSTGDDVLSNMTDLIHRAQQLATQGANFSNNQDGRNAIALEIDQIIRQLVQMGNTDVGGKYIFGGMRTDTPPFTTTTAGGLITGVSYVGTPAAQNWQRSVEVSRAVTMEINLNGDTLLGNTTGTPIAAHGLFSTLLNLRTDLQTPGVAQLDNIRSRLDTLNTDLNTVLAQQSKLGSVTNRLELTASRIEDRKSILTQQYADIQDIDAPSLIAELNHQDNIFQASLGVTARVVQTSLLNFLR